MKIPAIQLFDELGKLFDRELRSSVFSSKNGQSGQPMAQGDKHAADENSEFMGNAEEHVKSEQEQLNRKI